jgi:hypothetical protein
MKIWAVYSCILLSLAVSSGLLADPIQITGGVGGGTSGLCVTNCDNSPNLLVSGDIGVYMVSQNSSAAEELLVLLVPNDTTNLFSSDPFGTIKVYNTNPLASTGATGSSVLATPTNAASFGLNSTHYVSGGFYGTITSNSGSVKVGDYLGIGLSNSINMSNVSSESNSVTNDNTDVFGVYGILVTASLTGNQLLDINTSGIPEGTFVSVVTDTGLANPNSSAGVVDTPPSSVPEPASSALLATVIIGLAFSLRRKLKAFAS